MSEVARFWTTWKRWQVSFPGFEIPRAGAPP